MDDRTDRAIVDDREHALIALAIGGDADALRLVWERYRRWVAAILIAHKPRDADVEDLLQDVALMLTAKLCDVREPGAFKPWLRAVALSIAKAAGRRSTVRKHGWLRVVDSWMGRSAERARGDDSGPGGDFGNAGTGAHVSEEAARLLELARSLPDGYGEPLILKAVQGMSYREIGRVMSLPESTIETRIARARRMLRERAAQNGINEPSREHQLTTNEGARPSIHTQPLTGTGARA